MLDQVFDLSNVRPHERLFKSSEFPWDWVKNLGSYLGKFGDTRITPPIDDRVLLCTDSGPIIIEEGATIQDGAIIHGPTYIGRGSMVGYHSFVKGALILHGCVVGYCTQVKNSVFLAGAKAPHFNYVGDSVLGRQVNLGAGVKTGNLPLDSKPDKGITIVWEDGLKIDTRMRKLGAFVGDRTQVGCNCVLNPATVLGENCRVYGMASVGGTFGPNQRIRPDIKLKVTKQR